MTDREFSAVIKKHYRTIIVFFVTFLIGMIVHILGITNDVINHDSLGFVGGQSYWLRFQGKWAAGYLTDMLDGRMVTGSWFVPVGIMFLAAAACLIFRMLNIRRVLSGILIGATLVTFYTVASMTVYYGTAYFSCCFFLAVLGAFFIARCSILSGLLGIGVVCLSMGGYQPYIAAAASVLVLDCISRALFTEMDTKTVFVRGCWYVTALIAGVLCYYGILQYFKHTGYIELTDYQGIRALASGEIPIGAFLYSLDDAWKATRHFLFGRSELPYNAMPVLYAASVITAVVTFFISLFRGGMLRKPVRAILTALLVFVAFPIAVNLVVVLTVQGSVHDIMGYAIVLIFIPPIVLADGMMESSAEVAACACKNRWKFVVIRAVDIASIVVSVMLIVMWSCFINDLYRLLTLANNQLEADAVSVMSALYADEEYSADSAVVLLGNPPYQVLENKSSSIESPVVKQLHNSVVGIQPSNGFMNSAMMKQYLNDRLGADIVFLDEAEFYAEHKDECDGMPVFPGGKAVRCIDGVMVIKLGETGE